MKTKIIHKFRVVKIIAYKRGYYRNEEIQDRWVWIHTIDRDYFKDYYLLQQKRRFWFGYKTLEKSSWKGDLIDKMEKLKEIYGEYS